VSSSLNPELSSTNTLKPITVLTALDEEKPRKYTASAFANIKSLSRNLERQTELQHDSLPINIQRSSRKPRILALARLWPGQPKLPDVCVPLMSVAAHGAWPAEAALAWPALTGFRLASRSSLPALAQGRESGSESRPAARFLRREHGLAPARLVTARPARGSRTKPRHARRHDSRDSNHARPATH
jgi:hypothetical protein